MLRGLRNSYIDLNVVPEDAVVVGGFLPVVVVDGILHVGVEVLFDLLLVPQWQPHEQGHPHEAHNQQNTVLETNQSIKPTACLTW